MTADVPQGALTPTEVLRRARANVEHMARGGELSVVGEVWDFKVIKGGHWTFDLKDVRARLPCIVFFNDTKRIKFEVKHGLRVVAVGKPTVTDWAKLQLGVVRIDPVGEGAHDLAFRQLKEKLDGEGLFALDKKKPLPKLPRTVGVVTSSTGAAIRDVIKVLFDRMPRLRVVVAPTRVQGEGAGADVAEALRKLDKTGLCDVILVVRGGGSLEDLWAFNTESVARTIAGCRAPVVTGVGHQTDITIADLVADKRAATPSNAAEIAVPRLDELIRYVSADERRLSAAFRNVVNHARARFEKARRRLADPRHLLGVRRARVVELEKRMEKALQRRRERDRARVQKLEERLRNASPSRQVAERRAKLERVTTRLRAASPAKRIAQRRERVAALEAKLLPAVQAKRARLGRMMDVFVARLHAISPLQVLARGYAIARRDDGVVVRSPSDAPAGTKLELIVEKGTVRATVDPID